MICARSRLKTTLDLPLIEPSPPIPPRTYKKLYAYFDRSLAISAARKKAIAAVSAKPTPVSTPQKPKISTPLANLNASTSLASRQSPRLLPQRQTPSKEAAFSSFRNPKTGLKHVSSKLNEKPVPKWVAPCIRQLCKDLDTPRAIPHIMAGTESILCLPAQAAAMSTPGTGRGKGRATGGAGLPILKTKLHALIACLWFFTVIKLRGPAGQSLETSARKKMARESVIAFRSNPEIIAKIGESQEDWEGWGEGEGLLEKDVGEWRKEVLAKEWKDMDWYVNITEGEGVGDGEEKDSETDASDNLAEEDEGRVGKRVLDKYDYLSEVKQTEYEQWRVALLAKVNDLIAEAADEEMEG